MEELKTSLDLLKSSSEAAAARHTGRTGRRLVPPPNSLEASTPVEDLITKPIDELKALLTSRLDYTEPIKEPIAASSQDNLVRNAVEESKKLLMSTT